MINPIGMCKLIKLPTYTDERGSLTVLEGSDFLPFDVKRVFYMYDIPSGAKRAGHAHQFLHQCMVAISGSFTVVLRDPLIEKRYHLNVPFEGLYIPPLVWRDIDCFSSGAVVLVFASTPYDEGDYFDNFNEYSSFYRSVNGEVN